jgi:hypothetical protein
VFLWMMQNDFFLAKCGELARKTVRDSWWQFCRKYCERIRSHLENDSAGKGKHLKKCFSVSAGRLLWLRQRQFSKHLVYFGLPTFFYWKAKKAQTNISTFLKSWLRGTCSSACRRERYDEKLLLIRSKELRTDPRGPCCSGLASLVSTPRLHPIPNLLLHLRSDRTSHGSHNILIRAVLHVNTSTQVKSSPTGRRISTFENVHA